MVKDKKIIHDEIDSSSEEETAQEKRIRLAKEYIAELEEQGTWVIGSTFLCFAHAEKFKLDKSSVDHDAIAHRLKEDAVSYTKITEIYWYDCIVTAETKWKTP